MEAVWRTINDHRAAHNDANLLEAKRRTQSLDWLGFLLDEGLRHWFYENPRIKALLPRLRDEVAAGRLSPTAAADQLLGCVRESSPIAP